MTQELLAFLQSAGDLGESWVGETLDDAATRTVPGIALGTHGTLLRGDIALLWARWYLEALFERHGATRPGYAAILEVVRERFSVQFVGRSRNEVDFLAVTAARLVEEVFRRRDATQRRTPDKEQRHALLDLSLPKPHCWICGLRFEEPAIERFLGNRDSRPRLPAFVDFLKPCGLLTRHLQIEIDHVVPVAAGGEHQPDLRLACGWCNMHKSAHQVLYDVPAELRSFRHPRLGHRTVPQPFWVVRLLAIRGCCEYTSGCGTTPKDGPLTISPEFPAGAPNPTNLRVTCMEHDPIDAVDRLVARRFFQPEE
jgi:hypothetical protein